ncbi:hypothetical protein ACP275_10G040500 [Erythranthe tilingii]
MNNNGGNDDEDLNLSLSTTTPQWSTSFRISTRHQRPNLRRSRSRPNQTAAAAAGAGAIPPPYPWATSRRAAVHDLCHLQANGISMIAGNVQCKRCERTYEVEFDLHEKFRAVASYVVRNREEMRHRAPAAWMNPTLPDCRFCGQGNCVKPVLTKKKSINWLFLFLGELIGCCKLAELKYFCKHTKNHRTGAKDRVLYLTYLEICRQLDPIGPYDP